MSDTSELRISRRELLTSIFGEWPSFHDAEVLKVVLDRKGCELLASIYVFRMTSEVDTNGYYVLDNKVVATIRFTGIAQLELRYFNHQNVLFDLGIRDVSAEQDDGLNFEVEFNTSFGMEANFRCAEIEVVSVVPYNKA